MTSALLPAASGRRRAPWSPSRWLGRTVGRLGAPRTGPADLLRGGTGPFRPCRPPRATPLPPPAPCHRAAGMGMGGHRDTEDPPGRGAMRPCTPAFTQCVGLRRGACGRVGGVRACAQRGRPAGPVHARKPVPPLCRRATPSRSTYTTTASRRGRRGSAAQAGGPGGRPFPPVSEWFTGQLPVLLESLPLAQNLINLAVKFQGAVRYNTTAPRARSTA
jgi:hypothetical protein